EDTFRNAYQQAVQEIQVELFNSPAELGRTYPWSIPQAELWSNAILLGLKDGSYYPILPQPIVQALIGDNTPEGRVTAQNLRLRYSAHIILHTQEDNE
ncbi:hypothetical protein IJG04_02175, partial [Candidatus Saccharibacteria bacterium]|nr:hypothetical protein [Candidatus Saccharibacteria bacterium]